MTNLHPLMSTILSMKYLTGYNVKDFKIETVEANNEILNPQIIALDYVTSFFGNFNIMMIIQFSLAMVCGMIYLLSIKNYVFKGTFRFLQRTLFLIIVFNTTNVVFSWTIMNDTQFFEIIMVIVSGIAILIQWIHVMKKYRQYFGF